MQHQLIVDKIAMQPKFPNKLSSEQNTYNINTTIVLKVKKLFPAITLFKIRI